MGFMLNRSTRTFNTLGEINTGRVGPKRIFFIPKESKVSKIHTAFCSYQERTSDNGKSLTLHLNAFAKEIAILMAE